MERRTDVGQFTLSYAMVIYLQGPAALRSVYVLPVPEKLQTVRDHQEFDGSVRKTTSPRDLSRRTTHRRRHFDALGELLLHGGSFATGTYRPDR